MNYKKKIIHLIAVAFLCIGIGYALINLVGFEFDACGIGYRGEDGLSEKIELTPSCTGYRDFLESLDNKIGVPLVLFSIISIFLLSIQLFLREEIFRSWIRFATVFVPVSLIITIFSSPNDGDMFFPSTEEMSIFSLPTIFLITSILIITVKSLKLRKK